MSENGIKVRLIGEDYADIRVNDDLVLHINRNSEGYSVDMYETSKDNNYEDEENYDAEEGFLAGTYTFFGDMKQYAKD